MQQTSEVLRQLAEDPERGRSAFEAHARELERRGAWTELFSFYESGAALLDADEAYWKGAKERLRECISRVEDPSERAEAFNVLAELHLDHLGDALGAIQVWGEAFRADRSRVDLIEAASAAALSNREWRAACNLLELRSRIAKNPSDRSALLTRAAEIARDELGDEGHSQRLLGMLNGSIPPSSSGAREAVHADGEGRNSDEAHGAADATTGEAESSADAGGAVPSVEEGVKEAPSSAEAAGEASRAQRAGEGAEETPPAAEEASEDQATRVMRSQRVAKDSEEAPVATDVHASLAAEAVAQAEEGDTKGALDRLRKALRSTGRDRERSVPLLEALGRIHWQIASDRKEAAAVFKRLRLADPRNELMLRWFAEEQREAGDWKRLYATLLSLRDVVISDEEMWQISEEMVEIARDQLARPERAIDALKGALRRDPDHAEGRARLRELLALEGKWNALVELLRDEVERTPREDRARQVELHEELARIYGEELDLPVMVTNVYQSLLEVDPTNMRAVEALAERFQSSGRWNELASLHAERAPGIEESSERAEVWRKVARIRREQLGNPLLAAEAYEFLLEAEPADREALEALREIYEGRQDAESLFRIRELEAQLRPVNERVAALLELADHARSELGDVERCLAIYRRILEDVPDHEGAADALEAVLAEEGRVEEQAAFLRERLMQQEGTDLQLTRRLARLLQTRPEEREEAETLWRDVLVESEEDAEALASLEGMLSEAERWLDLEALQRDAGRLDDWLQRLAGADAPAPEALRRGAALAADELDDETLQLALLQRLDEIEPGRKDTLQRIDALLAQRPERAEERLPILHQLLGLSSDEDEKGRRELELARFLWQKLDDGAGAFPWYLQVLETNPEEIEVWSEVRDAALAAGLADALFEEMTQAAARMARGEARVMLHRELARLAMGPVDRQEEALGFWNRVLEHERDDIEALDAAIALQRKQELWEDLAGFLLRRSDLADSDSEALTMRCEAASLMIEEVGAVELALDVLDTILADAPEHAEARSLRRRALERSGRWDEVFEQLREELADASGSAAAALRLELADAVTRHGEPGEEVVELLVDTLDDAAHAAEAEAALLEHVRNAAPGSEHAALVLLERLRGSADAETLELLVDLGLQEIEEEGERRSLLLDLAERWLESEDPEAAMRSLQRVFAHGTPGQAELHRQRVIADAGASLDALVTLWRAAFEHEPDRELGMALAEVLRFELERDAEATEILEALREVSSGDRPVLEALEALYRPEADGAALAEVLLELSELDVQDAVEEEGPGSSGWKRMERALALFRGPVDAPEEARAVLERMMEMAPGAPEPAEALEDLLFELEAFEDLDAHLLRRVALAESSDERVQLQLRRAGLLDGPMGRPEEAVEAWRALLDDAPGHEVALAHLDRLHAQLGNHAERLSVLRERLRQSSAEDAPGLRLEAASLLMDELYEPAEAVPLVCEVLEGRPEHPVAFSLALRLWRELSEDAAGRLALAPLLSLALDSGAHDADMGLRRSLVRFQLEMGELEAGDAWLRIAELAQAEGARKEALAALVRAACQASTEAASVALMDRIWSKLDDRDAADAVVAAADEVIAAEEGPSEGMAGVLLLRALLAEEVEEDLDLAVDLVERAIALAPERAALQDAQERLLERSRQWPALVDVLRWRAEARDVPAERAALLYRAALISAHQIGDDEEALDLLQRIVALGHGTAEVYQLLGVLLEQGERWDDLAILLQARAANAGERGEEVATLLELARLSRERLGAWQEALDALGQANALEAGSPVVAQELRALLGEGALAEEASRALLDGILDLAMQAHAIPEDLPELLDLGASWVRQVRTRGELETLPAPVAHLIAEVSEADAWERSEGLWRELAPVPTIFLALQSEFRVALSHLASPLSVLESALDGARDAEPAQALALLPLIAGLARTLSGGETIARAALALALELDPQSEEASRELETLLRQTGDMESLAEEYERRLMEASDPEQMQRTTHQLARLREEELGDVPGARAAYEAWLLEMPTDTAAREELARICRAQEDFEGLAEVLDEWIDQCDDEEERRSLLMELASLHEHERESAQDAADTLGRALGTPLADAGVVEEALRLLEQAGRVEDMLDALAISEASGALDPGYRLALRCRRAALLANSFDEVAQAVATLLSAEAEISGLDEAARSSREEELLRLLALDGCDLDTALLVAAHAREGGHHRLHVAALEAALRDALGSAVEADLIKELAQVEHIRGATTEREFELWSQALILQPEDQESLAALVSTGNTLDDPARVAAVLEEVRATGDAPPHLLVMLADLYVVRLDQPEEAVACLEDLEVGSEVEARRRILQQVLDVPSLRERALQGLDELLDENADPPEIVAAVLEHRLGAAGDPLDRVLLLEQLADLHEGALQSPARAFDFMTLALREAPEMPEILSRAIALAREAADWHRLVSLLTELAHEMEDAFRAGELLVAAMDLASTRLKDSEIALEIAEDGLARELETPELVRRGRDALQEIGAESRPELWVEFSRRALEEEGDPERANAARMDLALFIVNHGLDAEVARELLDVLRDAPEQAERAWQLLERIAVEEENWEELASLLEEQAMQADSAEAAHPCRLRLLQLLDTELDDGRRAVDVAREILENEPEHVGAIEVMERRLREDGAWEELQDHLMDRLGQADSDEARSNALLRLADNCIDNLDDTPGAISWLEQARSIREFEEQASERLEALYRRDEDWTGLVQLLAERSESAKGATRYRLLREQALILEEHLSDYRAAEPLLRELRTEHPEDPETAAALLRILADRGDADVDGIIGELRAQEALGELRSCLARRGDEYLSLLD